MHPVVVGLRFMGLSLVLLAPRAWAFVAAGGPEAWVNASVLLGYAALTGFCAAATDLVAPEGRWPAWWTPRGVGVLYGVGVGILLLIAHARLEGTESWAHTGDLAGPFHIQLVTFLHYAGVGLQEEVVYRGAAQSLLMRHLPKGPAGVTAAILLASAPWAFMHGHGGAWWWIVGLTEADGLVYGLLRWRFGLASAIAAHMAFDIVLAASGLRG